MVKKKGLLLANEHREEQAFLKPYGSISIQSTEISSTMNTSAAEGGIGQFGCGLAP